MVQNIKKYKSYIIIAVITLLIIVIGFTVAYFQAQVGTGATANVTVTTKTTDVLTFSKGNDINITATQANFGSGAGNKTGSTTASATLLANNDTNSATQTYNVYLLITNNNFVYTTDPTNTPELMLTITNPNNQAVTSLTGLTYTTSGGVSGFDITEKDGLIQIASDYSITSTGTKTDTWNVTVSLINLNSDQQANTDKIFAGQVIIQKEEYTYKVEYANCTNPSITNTYFMSCDHDLLACKVAKDFDYTDIANSKVVLHNGIVLNETGAGSNKCAILDVEDNSYRYTGGDYDVTQTAISAGYNYVNTYNGNTTGGVIGVNCSGTNRYVGYDNSTCSTKYYYLLYDTNVTQYATYEAAASQAITDGYIVARNLNNYVCYGYDTSVPANATTCPEQNLYRIIGAFDDDNDGNYNVKLIKADYASTTEFGTNAQNGTSSYFGDYISSRYTGYHGTQSSGNKFYWYGTNSNFTNRWDNSTFRSEVLNNYYLNAYLNGNGTVWKNMIEETTYYLGGYGKTGYGLEEQKYMYIYERTAEAVYDIETYPASIDDYIGLMYVSDFEYAAKIKQWTSGPRYRSNGRDWLYNGLYEWTISPKSDTTSNAIYITTSGVHNFSTSIGGSLAVRPVMYLKPSVEVTSGTGSKTDPYYIDLPS